MAVMGSVIVDDSDLARILYSKNPAWVVSKSVYSEFGQSAHGTSNAGAKATFVFNGTSVQVCGTTNGTLEGNPDPIMEFLLDGNSSAGFVPRQGLQYNETLFQSEHLQPREHTFVMTTILGNLSWVWLDYIVYMPFAEEETSASPIMNTSSTDAAQATDTVPTTATATTHASSSKSADTPAIIGGAVGGAAAVLVIGCLVALLCYRKRSLKRRSTTQRLESPSPGVPTPFMLETLVSDVIRRKGSSVQTETLPSGSRSVVTEVSSPPSYQSVAGVD